MENNILIRGKGYITKIALNSINGFDAFAGKKNKRLFIDILEDECDEKVVLIAYCVLDSNAHFIIKTNNKGDADSFVSRVCSRYGDSYNGQGRGYPLRNDFISQKIKSENLRNAVAYVHALAPVTPIDYPYCSYEYLADGYHGGTAVIIAENGGEMKEAEFMSWLDSSAGKGFKKVKVGNEKFSKVLKEEKLRYLNGRVSEQTLVYVIAELCERTGAKYKKSARVLGVSYKERRDIMIATLNELIRRKHTFSDAIAIMQIFAEDRTALLLDCIVELNRVHGYSYDHIINSFGVDDYYYDILAEILRGLHRKFGYGFEELCVKYHLQNEIIPLRMKCGF